MVDTTAGVVPDVSILMTVFNTAPFLAEAIDSILAQRTQHSWELIVVDDGSSDGSDRIAQAYRTRSAAWIRTLQHPAHANLGISRSRNLALEHARGRYIAFLDSDDLWLPHHLATMVPLLEAHPEAQMAYAAAERWVDAALPFDETRARQANWGQNYLPRLVPAGEAAGLLPPGRLLEWFRKDESLVPCICSVLVRTAAARRVGGFCNEFRGLYDDQAFHAKMSLQFPIYAEDVCVARYRQHTGSCCAHGRKDRVASGRERQRFIDFLTRLEEPARADATILLGAPARSSC